MDRGTISTRYARALFSLAKDKRQESLVYDDMRVLAESFSLAPKLWNALDNPIVSDDEKRKLLRVAGGIEVCDLYERFICLVLEHRRETLLPFIAYIYMKMYRLEKKIARVRFETAVPVGDEVKERLQAKLCDETGCTVEFSGQVVPELIGGFRLCVGNYRVDASYATQLRDIRERLIENR